MQEPIRLQKLLASFGVGSRRYCEILIERGRVQVNGVVVKELGSRASESDEIRVDGVLLVSRPATVVIALNKPAGTVSSMADPQGRPDLSAYQDKIGHRLFHVGRLDEATEGLLILTNDGDLAQKLAHPRHQISKTYLAEVDGSVSRGTLKRLRSGVELPDGPISADQAIVKQEWSDRTLVQVVLHSGRNRIVRRMLAAVGHPVIRLVRTHIGGLGLDGLRPGEFRHLTELELRTLAADSEI